jgi:hypothetical protein
MAKVEPKFRVGELAQHKLGFKCLIVSAFTEAKIKAKEGEEEEIKELEIPVYAVHFLAANGGIVESQVREDALEAYVAP